MPRPVVKHVRPNDFGTNSYICSRCQNKLRKYNTASPVQMQTSTRPRSLPESLRSPPSTQASYLHLTARTANVDQQPGGASKGVDIPLGSFSIRREWGADHSKSELHLPGRSVIRDQLRAWSVQNEGAKKIAAEGGFTQSGNVKALPESLFIEEDDEELMMENEELDEYDESLEGRNKLNLVPGDVLKVFLKVAKPQLAVFLGQIDYQYQFLLGDGRWAVDTVPVPQTIVLRNYATSEEVDAIREVLPKKALTRPNGSGIAEPFAFAGQLSQELSAPILGRLKKLLEDASAFHRLHINTLDNIYELFAEEANFLNITFAELIKRAFGQDLRDLSHGAQLAFFRALERDPGKTHVQNAVPEEMFIIMTPKNSVRQFEKVTRWAREYQESAAQAALGKNVSATLKRNPLNDFIEKSRRLIIMSRKIRAPTTIGVLGPTSGKIQHEGPIKLQETGEVYTENDKMILEFLWNTFLRNPFPSHVTRDRSIGSLILRAIGAYPNLRLERKIGRLLLQEIGSLAPWCEAVDHNVATPVPGLRGAHVANKFHQESEKLAMELIPEENPQKIPMTDTMADLRKDWGDTEVLCIDKPSARILDDGLSVEPDAKIPGAVWIHVHIAHPSAFVDPEHLFARRARHFGSTLYTRRQTYMMLPHRFAMALSLAPGKPVSTVSSLLMPDGEVREVKMSVGIVNKVTRLDPAAVDIILGRSQVEKATMTVGVGKLPQSTLQDEAIREASKHQEVLHTMKRLLDARVRHRHESLPEYANWSVGLSDIDVNLSFLEPYDEARLMRSYHYVGDPAIRIQADRHTRECPLGERHLLEPLTAAAMILAGESGGRWLKERNIPAIYNGSLTHPEYPISRMNKLASHEPRLMPRTTVKSYPIPHVFMSVAQYARMTSPLRRYPDILSQWQIDAFLKAEAAGSMPSGSDTGTFQLPHTAQMIDDYILRYEDAVARNERLMRKSDIFWTFQALFRAFHFKEAVLPEIWDFRVDEIRQTSTVDEPNIRGRLHPFNVNAALLNSPELWESAVKFRQYLPVKIQLVDVSKGCVCVRAVGPSSDTPTQTDPIHIKLAPQDGIGTTEAVAAKEL